MKLLTLISILLIASSCANRVWLIKRNKTGGVIGYQARGEKADLQKQISSTVHCSNYEFTAFENKSKNNTLTLYEQKAETTYHSGGVTNQYGNNVGHYGGTSTKYKEVPVNYNIKEQWVEATYVCKSGAKVAQSATPQTTKDEASSLEKIIALKDQKKKLIYLKEACYNYEHHYLRGMACFEAGNTYSEENIEPDDTSVDFYERAHASIGTQCESAPYFCYASGRSAFKVKNYDNAERIWNKLISGNKDMNMLPYYLNELGNTQKETGSIKKAHQNFEKACVLDQKYGCYNLAVLLADQGKKSEASKQFEKALKLGYNHWKWLRNKKGLESLRGLGNFNSLIKKYSSRKIASEK